MSRFVKSACGCVYTSQLPSRNACAAEGRTRPCGLHLAAVSAAFWGGRSDERGPGPGGCEDACSEDRQRNIAHLLLHLPGLYHLDDAEQGLRLVDDHRVGDHRRHLSHGVAVADERGGRPPASGGCLLEEERADVDGAANPALLLRRLGVEGKELGELGAHERVEDSALPVHPRKLPEVENREELPVGDDRGGGRGHELGDAGDLLDLGEVLGRLLLDVARVGLLCFGVGGRLQRLAAEERRLAEGLAVALVDVDVHRHEGPKAALDGIGYLHRRLECVVLAALDHCCGDRHPLVHLGVLPRRPLNEPHGLAEAYRAQGPDLLPHLWRNGRFCDRHFCGAPPTGALGRI